jgi:hypothetical protein
VRDSHEAGHKAVRSERGTGAGGVDLLGHVCADAGAQRERGLALDGRIVAHVEVRVAAGAQRVRHKGVDVGGSGGHGIHGVRVHVWRGRDAAQTRRL